MSDEETGVLRLTTNNDGALVIMEKDTKEVIVAIPKRAALGLLMEDSEMNEWKEKGARPIFFGTVIASFVVCLGAGLYEFAITFDKVVEKVSVPSPTSANVGLLTLTVRPLSSMRRMHFFWPQASS